MHTQQNHADWIAAARRQADAAGAPGGSSAQYTGQLRITLPPPFLVADFDIVREIHRGGQGVVYEARQRSIPRTVAIKVMRAGPFAGESERLRFEREIGILAHLRHRNIVGILERGQADGSHFLVMDYVDGVPLDRYAKSQDLSVAARLALFGTVCDAVGAAHLRGVIHRDLKPSNILIDAAGEPRILDFGLATRVDGSLDSDATQTGQFMGSLPWVSPEQALGQLADVDMRSDVYSLGVVLYQLLTDCFPYSTSGSLESALASVRTSAPVRPRTLRRDIDDDLETIVLKCLQKDPTRRYQSVSELAADVRHYLVREPIQAKRDSGWYVLRKALRRNFAATLVAVAFVLLVSAALIIAITLWQRAAQQRDRAQFAEGAERTQRQRAQAEAAKAQAATEFLQDALAAASPEVSSGRDLSVREVMVQATLALDAGSLADQPQVESAVRATIGDSYLALGHAEAAVVQYQTALRLGSDADAGPSAEVASLQGRLAEAYIAQDRFSDAEPVALAALDQIRKAHQGDHMDVVKALRVLAQVYAGQNRRGEVSTLRHEALAMHARVLGENDFDVLHSRLVLALEEHNLSDCAQLAEQIIALDASGELPVDPVSAATVFRTIGGVLHLLGDYPGAASVYGRALTATGEVYGPDHPRVVNLLTEISFLQRSRGDDAAAEAVLSEACSAARAAYGENDSRYADLLVQRVVLVLMREDIALAESLIAEVMAMDEAGNPSNHWTRAQATSLQGEALMRRGQLAAAEPLLLAGYDGIVASQVLGDLRHFAAIRLAKLYELLGQQDLAAEWRARADAE